ncbi:Type IV pili methyl-accepting chemotaxis transducer N-term [Puniceibacterium sediminis]|uniref:Type IV pili methyl-accepting chemotaxis transducer N-term n=2 Tax=Puniceibacterium sediminis TaxID=1608407 RepID=A0A238W6Z8_9RHOB|nr:Type IV pili methyl-accepting chemotaxis transducer N-term [Puniceibacterium sediminis]
MKFILIVVTTLVLMVDRPVWAAMGTPPVQGAQKIDLAGRQRMLSQRMSKALCMARAGIHKNAHRDMAARTIERFSETLHQVAHGNVSCGMSSERDPEILARLNDVSLIWEPFAAAAMTGTDKDMSDAEFAKIYEGNLPLLVVANDAVTHFEKVYSSKTMDPLLASTINITGAQRMLSQKAVKELCMVHLGVSKDADRAALQRRLNSLTMH